MNIHAVVRLAVLPGALAWSEVRESAAGADCPESCINEFCWKSAAADTFHSRGGGEFDLAAGYVDAWGCGGGGTVVRARDRFVLRGVASTVPVDIRASLTYWGCGRPFGHDQGASFSATLIHGSMVEQTDSIQACPVDGNLTLIVPIVPETEFELSYWISAGGSAGDCGQAHGTLSFAGLPPGGRIESCNGFILEVPVAAIASTWGSVKARYR